VCGLNPLSDALVYRCGWDSALVLAEYDLLWLDRKKARAYINTSRKKAVETALTAVEFIREEKCHMRHFLGSWILRRPRMNFVTHYWAYS